MVRVLVVATLAASLAGVPAAAATAPGANGRIVFTLFSYADDQELGSRSGAHLLAVDPATGRPLPLATCRAPAPNCQDSDPAFSPDGSRLVFVRGVLDPDAFDTTLITANLVSALPDGRGRQQLASNVFSNGAFSPSGDRLMFGGERGMLVMDSGGGELSPINELARAQDIDWSATGMLAFARRGAIFTSRPGGRALRRLTRDVDAYGPSFSPDGARIAYYRFRSGGGREVWVMRADGSGKRLLTRGGDPEWSPDGRLIAFGRHRALRVISPEGGFERLLFKAREHRIYIRTVSGIAWRPLPR
jgi:Tol biopolymer transport system component